MKYLKVRNWDTHQRYRKDRGAPPWIPLYRKLQRDPEWVTLTSQERGWLVDIWMLAAERNGEFPSDPNVIKALCCMSEVPDLSKLSHFICQVDVHCQSTVSPMDAPEERRGDKSREERGREDAPAKPSRKKPPTPIPDPFSVTDAMKKWASEKVPTIGIDIQTQKFINYSKQHDRRCQDWVAAWRNWMLKQLEWQAASPTKTKPSMPELGVAP